MNVGQLIPWGTARRIPIPKRGPQARHRAAVIADGNSLRFTDWLLLTVLAVAYFISISMPLLGVQLHLSVLNHFPLLLLGPVLALHMLGISLTRSGLRWAPVGAVTWPLIVLGLYALIGSSVAKWEFGVDDSYISFGVYLLLLPVFAASVPGGKERTRSFATALIVIWVLFSMAAFIGETARFGNAGLLHEIEYLVAAGFFIFYYAFRSRAVKFLALVLLIAAAVVNQKLTGYIICAVAILYIVVAAGWRRLLPTWRGAYTVGAVIFILTVVTVLALLYFEFRDFLPSGNVDVRTHQYQAVWRDFIASPVWGHAYLTGSGEDFKSGYSLIYIPTHSDVLDILKHGGLIGLALFAWGYIAIFLTLGRAVAATRADMLLNAFFVGARFFQVTALITFSLNPILLKGPFLIVIWGNLGLALGLALRVLAQAQIHSGAAEVSQFPAGALSSPGRWSGTFKTVAKP